jgi:hypothetical protein
MTAHLSPEQLAALLPEIERMLKMRWTASQIATAVGRSRGSIVGLVHRHLKHVGFYNPSPDMYWKARAKREARRISEIEVFDGPTDQGTILPEGEPVVPRLVTKPPKPIEPVPEPEPELPGIRLAAIKDTQCRWPLWADEVTDPSHKRYCGAAVARLRYCAEHAKRAFTAPR